MRPASNFRLHRLHSRCVILVRGMNKYLIGLCALTLPVWASENITLKTGYTLAADRHEVSDGTIRIFSGDEVTEMPASLIASVEQVQEPPKVEAPAPVSESIAAPIVAIIESAAIIEKPVPAETTPIALALTAAHKYSLPD